MPSAAHAASVERSESLASRIAAERAQRQRRHRPNGAQTDRVRLPAAAMMPRRPLVVIRSNCTPTSPSSSPSTSAKERVERSSSHDLLRSFDGRTDKQVDSAFERLLLQSCLPVAKQRCLMELYVDADVRRRYSMLREFTTYLKPLGHDGARALT